MVGPRRPNDIFHAPSLGLLALFLGIFLYHVAESWLPQVHFLMAYDPKVKCPSRQMSYIKFQEESDGLDYMFTPNQSLYGDLVLWPAWVTCTTWLLQHGEEGCGLYHPWDIREWGEGIT